MMTTKTEEEPASSSAAAPAPTLQQVRGGDSGDDRNLPPPSASGSLSSQNNDTTSTATTVETGNAKSGAASSSVNRVSTAAGVAPRPTDNKDSPKNAHQPTTITVEPKQPNAAASGGTDELQGERDSSQQQTQRPPAVSVSGTRQEQEESTSSSRQQQLATTTTKPNSQQPGDDNSGSTRPDQQQRQQPATSASCPSQPQQSGRASPVPQYQLPVSQAPPCVDQKQQQVTEGFGAGQPVAVAPPVVNASGQCVKKGRFTLLKKTPAVVVPAVPAVVTVAGSIPVASQPGEIKKKGRFTFVQESSAPGSSASSPYPQQSGAAATTDGPVPNAPNGNRERTNSNASNVSGDGVPTAAQSMKKKGRFMLSSVAEQGVPSATVPVGTIITGVPAQVSLTTQHPMRQGPMVTMQPIQPVRTMIASDLAQSSAYGFHQAGQTSQSITPAANPPDAHGINPAYSGSTVVVAPAGQMPVSPQHVVYANVPVQSSDSSGVAGRLASQMMQVAGPASSQADLSQGYATYGTVMMPPSPQVSHSNIIAPVPSGQLSTQSTATPAPAAEQDPGKMSPVSPHAQQPPQQQRPRRQNPPRNTAVGFAGRQGLGKVFYFLDQMRLEVTDADRMIRNLQMDIKHLVSVVSVIDVSTCLSL